LLYNFTLQAMQHKQKKERKKVSIPTTVPAVLSSLERYLIEVKKYPYLSREEEEKIAKEYYDQGDLKAAEKLVTANLRLVVKIAYEYFRTGFKVMDLIQEGNIGLMQAVKEFNPYRGIRLATYASWWIKAYIQNFLIKNWSLVKIGTTQAQRKLFYKLEQERKRLLSLGITPEVKLLSENLGVKEKEVTEMTKRLSGRDASLDAPIGPDEGATLMDFQSTHTEDYADVLANRETLAIFRDKLDDFVKTLKGKSLYVFERRIMSDEPMTLQEIGDEFGITRERVRQIEVDVIGRLKEYIKQHAPELGVK